MLLFLLLFLDDSIGFSPGLSKISLRRYVIIMLLTRHREILVASALGSPKIAILLWGFGALNLIVICIVKDIDKIEKKLFASVKAA